MKLIFYMLKQKEMKWISTNILLKQEGFEGIKTGNTMSAGSCLSV